MIVDRNLLDNIDNLSVAITEISNWNIPEGNIKDNKECSLQLYQ